MSNNIDEKIIVILAKLNTLIEATATNSVVSEQIHQIVSDLSLDDDTQDDDMLDDDMLDDDTLKILRHENEIIVELISMLLSDAGKKIPERIIANPIMKTAIQNNRELGLHLYQKQLSNFVADVQIMSIAQVKTAYNQIRAGAKRPDNHLTQAYFKDIESAIIKKYPDDRNEIFGDREPIINDEEILSDKNQNLDRSKAI